MTDSPAAPHSRVRELIVVGVLALGFGLVGIDRFLISTLFPVIAKDLHLNYGDIGMIGGALALAWGIAALFMGNMSDTIGRRRVLVGALIVFSLLIGASGLAGGLLALVAVRFLMGLADGAYTPVSIAATIDASPPRRHGLNVGIQQTMLPLFGLGLAPLLVTQLLHVVGWRMIFSIFTLPGLVVAFLLWRLIPAAAARDPAAPPRAGAIADWRQVIGFSNIKIAMGMMLCWLTCLITCATLLPSYLVDHLHLDPAAMGGVMSAIGLGSVVGTLIMPALSDRIGRKPVMIIGAAGAALAMIVLMRTGADPARLFAALFMVNFFNNALITLTVGPISSETAPPHLIATASGVVIATGELLGGFLAPIAAGQVAQQWGIAHILWLPIIGLTVGVGLTIALKETLAPRAGV